MRAEWLPQVLRDAGLTVHEQPGWRARGKEMASILGVVCHHTATGPRTSDASVVALLIKGRPDLKGPLCQLGLRRDGSFDLIAAGKGNHNGYGEWGNQSIGIEAYNDGVGEPWPDVQVRAYEIGVAAILAHLGLDAQHAKGHKETDPGRKIDPSGIDMSRFRTAVAAHIRKPPMPTRPPTPGGLTVADINDIIRRLDEIELRVTQLQQECVGTLDKDGKSRMDRMAKTLDTVAADVKALKA